MSECTIRLQCSHCHLFRSLTVSPNLDKWRLDNSGSFGKAERRSCISPTAPDVRRGMICWQEGSCLASISCRSSSKPCSVVMLQGFSPDAHCCSTQSFPSSIWVYRLLVWRIMTSTLLLRSHTRCLTVEVIWTHEVFGAVGASCQS